MRADRDHLRVARAHLERHRARAGVRLRGVVLGPLECGADGEHAQPRGDRLRFDRALRIGRRAARRGELLREQHVDVVARLDEAGVAGHVVDRDRNRPHAGLERGREKARRARRNHVGRPERRARAHRMTQQVALEVRLRLAGRGGARVVRRAGGFAVAARIALDQRAGGRGGARHRLPAEIGIAQQQARRQIGGRHTHAHLLRRRGRARLRRRDVQRTEQKRADHRDEHQAGELEKMGHISRPSSETSGQPASRRRPYGEQAARRERDPVRHAARRREPREHARRTPGRDADGADGQAADADRERDGPRMRGACP